MGEGCIPRILYLHMDVRHDTWHYVTELRISMHACEALRGFCKRARVFFVRP